ncbi:ABC transporter ATP-binding protein [Thorsellia anophelis]|uniref:ABC-type dipeptide transporter n=1 Tax=Thorsellia anophelis DSM 18579 TaxID=1123402 RepID=A0A1I0ATK0_9GAMM|nr:ABC transporter ATP-binding protein [Thorsellia anophelis]SES97744.1 peptide/nickel transport system ATP-binding protein [Thorsellia anophelis DSM 18579]
MITYIDDIKDIDDSQVINIPTDNVTPILTIKDLTVDLSSKQSGSYGTIIKDINLSLGSEVLALIGESGSGKSTLAKSIIGILPSNMKTRATAMHLSIKPHEPSVNLMEIQSQKKARGQHISMIMQDPKYALNPALTLKKQLELAYLGKLNHIEKQTYFNDILAQVGLNHTVLTQKPSALSGGMGQRFMIALALLNKPKLIIADEPTSALDADMKQHIMTLLIDRCKQHNIGLLLISHDLQAVTQFADRILIMKSGEIVDSGDRTTLQSSNHPYTRLLWSCRPSAKTYGKFLASTEQNQ